VIVVDGGKVVTDGPKETVLAALRTPAAPTVTHTPSDEARADTATKE
jgi:ATP-binding cassette subfamily C protein LapB